MLRPLLAACLSAQVSCGAPPEPPPPTASAKPATAAPVGYDLRRLRPRDEEPLAAMFERLRAAALGEGKRVAVLFSADWCQPCRDLETELGNRHPAAEIGDVRIFELKEEDWQAAARLDEFNALRGRWTGETGTYPLLLLLDPQGKQVDEMKQAIKRLEAEGREPTLARWFADTRPTG